MLEAVVVGDDAFMADQGNSFSHVQPGEFLTAQWNWSKTQENGPELLRGLILA